MSNGMPRNRSRRSNRISPALRRQLRREHHADFRGIVARGRTDVPRVLLTPWNTIVVPFTIINSSNAAANNCLDFKSLSDYFIKQCGNSVTSMEVLFRIISIQVWHLGTEANVNNVVRLRCLSLIEGVNTCSVADTIAQIEDRGDRSRNATAKFIWPKTHSSNTFPDSSSRVFARITIASGQTVNVHVHCLWRFIGNSVQSDNPTASELFNSPVVEDLVGSFDRINL